MPSDRHTRHKNSRLTAYLVNHAQVTLASLGRLYRQPVASMMTIAVIAIALTLPTGMFIAVSNLGQLGSQWDSSTQITAYLQTGITGEQRQALLNRLRLHKAIEHIRLIDKDEGLKQFRQVSGFDQALQFLDENPLPDVFVIQPVTGGDLVATTASLLEQLRREKRIAHVQLDAVWVQRLFAILEIANRSIWVIGGMLGLAVLLIVGNTIRLDIQNRREEIEVAKLIGASNAFIRRPFLYTGLWYGLLGGLLAWLLTTLALWLIEPPVQSLARLYHSDFQLQGQNADQLAVLVTISCLLGLGGSMLAVSRHLKTIEPS